VGDIFTPTWQTAGAQEDNHRRWLLQVMLKLSERGLLVGNAITALRRQYAGLCVNLLVRS
jgi:hypothetical protein